MKFFALVAAVSANTYDFMGEDELLAQLSTTLSSAQRSEARGDGDAAVAKTAAIKNIQKALTAIIPTESIWLLSETLAIVPHRNPYPKKSAK